MARNSDKLTANFDTENTGGVLSGFLAEEDVFDRRALWRLGTWGAASVGAVVLAVYANQSSISLHHERVAVSADLARQAQQIQLVAKESESEAGRLAAAIETLNGDRDRLFSRVTGLEQGLESVTGALAKQQAAASPAAVPASAAAAATTEPPPAQNPPSAPVLSPVATTSPKGTEKAPAPAVSPVATAAPKAADKPSSAAAVPDVAPATVASLTQKPSNPPAATATPAIVPAAPQVAAPLVAEKSMMGPPDAAASKLIEPEKPEKSEKSERPEKPAKVFTAAPLPEIVAATSPSDNAEPDAAKPTPPKLAVQRTEFGVDVGGANSVGGLRALWRGLLKSKSNAALTTLRPIIVIKEGSNGLGMQLRLVAGPLSDAAAAAKICAGLTENERSCETAVFDGQRLAMTAEEQPAAADKPVAAKPAISRYSVHRRGAPKRVAVEEPTKKPDPPPSTLSSFFRRQN